MCCQAIFYLFLVTIATHCSRFPLFNINSLQLNDDYYECLTKETTIALLEACKKGAPPKVGK